MSDTSTNPGTKAGYKAGDSEKMFTNAEKGQIIVAGESRHKVLSVDRDGLGRFLTILLHGKKTKLYFKEAYQSLQTFVPDRGFETLPGSTNFTIEPAE